MEFRSEIGYLQAKHSPSFRGKMTNAAEWWWLLDKCRCLNGLDHEFIINT
jgi:hypothetical protein